MEVGQRPLQEVVKSSDAMGVSRLRINQFFAPERIVTLMFKEDRIAVEVLGPKEGDSEVGAVHYDNAPEWIESWDHFRQFVSPLESCQELGVYDGTVYSHTIYGSEGYKAVTWSNPSWLKHPRQMTVIRAYVEIAESAGLKRLIRMWRG